MIARLLPLAFALFTSLAFAGESDQISKTQALAIEREMAAETRRSLAAARGLDDYDRLKSLFHIDYALLGHVNSMPEALFVELHSIKRRPIDAAWWWNPLSSGKVSLSWRDFLAAYSAAERVVAKHPWLSKLTNLPGKRSLELHLLGTSVGASADDLATFILPAWRNGGMQGPPTYCFLARRGKSSWTEYFFSDDDDRAFVRYSLNGDPNPQSPLDRLEIHWHPRAKLGESSSQYATIAPDGSIALHTYVMDEQ